MNGTEQALGFYPELRLVFLLGAMLGLLALAADLCIFMLNSRSGKRQRRSPRLSYFVLWGVLCFALTLMPPVFSNWVQYILAEEPPEADISVRIEEIANQLAESSKELSDLQKELENRIATVEDLKREAEIAESVISLTDEQVSAIQAKLNQQLEASSGKSLWQNILVSAAFFLLGLLMRPAIDLVKRLVNRGKQAPEPKFAGYTQEEVERAIDLLDTLNGKEKVGR